MADWAEVGLQISPSGKPWLAAVPEITRLQLWDRWIAAWLPHLTGPQPAAGGYELGILLTDDGEIRQFNRDYRGQDNPTDVLAFATADDAAAPSWAPDCPVYLGDVVISIETAQRVQQAAPPRPDGTTHSLVEEIAWLAAHGVLHLWGWDHPDSQQLNQMLQKQAQLLREVGLRAPYTQMSDLTPLPGNC